MDSRGKPHPPSQRPRPDLNEGKRLSPTPNPKYGPGSARPRNNPPNRNSSHKASQRKRQRNRDQQPNINTIRRCTAPIPRINAIGMAYRKQEPFQKKSTGPPKKKLHRPKPMLRCPSQHHQHKRTIPWKHNESRLPRRKPVVKPRHHRQKPLAAREKLRPAKRKLRCQPPGLPQPLEGPER